MTKTITIPLSKETCDKIKTTMGLTLWILATVGLLYTFISMWFNFYDLRDVDRVTTGTLCIIGGGISIVSILKYFHDKGFWISFQCKCEVDEK